MREENKSTTRKILKSASRRGAAFSSMTPPRTKENKPGAGQTKIKAGPARLGSAQSLPFLPKGLINQYINEWLAPLSLHLWPMTQGQISLALARGDLCPGSNQEGESPLAGAGG